MTQAVRSQPRSLCVRASPWVLPLLLVCACSPAGAAGEGRDYVAPASLDRVAAVVAPVALPAAGMIQDFDVAGERLYLLEREGRVVVLVQAGDAWRFATTFGRPGAGPGEFRNASGIAATSEDVVVADWGRLQRFSTAGELLSTEQLLLPCIMARPSVAAGATGLFVHGNCMRAAYATDTMKAVLAWAPPGGEFRIVAEDVRFTLDGRVGSILGAPLAFTDGPAGRHLFGTGVANCVWQVEERGAGGRATPDPSIRAVCPAVQELYSADPPPELERRLRRGIRGVSLGWPKTLPVYVSRLLAGESVILLRPVSADSLVLQVAGPAGEASADLAVAPMDGFVGCRSGGCLWAIDEGMTQHVLFLDTTRLRRLSEAQAGR